MKFDPLSMVIDSPIEVGSRTIHLLTELLLKDKFNALFDEDGDAGESQRLEAIINCLIEILIKSVSANKTKLWVLQQFKESLERVELEDTEARELFGVLLEEIMDILGIESSDGLLAFYLGT